MEAHGRRMSRCVAAASAWSSCRSVAAPRPACEQLLRLLEAAEGELAQLIPGAPPRLCLRSAAALAASHMLASGQNHFSQDIQPDCIMRGTSLRHSDAETHTVPNSV